MSRLQLAFGTRIGQGKHLAEEVRDVLCEDCSSILENLQHLTYNPDTVGVLHIGSSPQIDCRLCKLLVDEFHAEGYLPPFCVDYQLTVRFGFLYGAYDLVFRTRGSEREANEVVKLGVQFARNSSSEGDNNVSTSMVHFESRLGTSTNSPKSMAQAETWLEECLQHDECRTIPAESSFIPTRLVEILDVDYATLSHRWSSKMPFILTQHNFQKCLQSIPDKSISPVFTDAVRVAWRMNIRYIWIDTLCIKQDVPEDWAAESLQMGSVYQHGLLNIAATGLVDGNQGLFVERSSVNLQPIAVSLKSVDDCAKKYYEARELPDGDYYLVNTTTWRNGVDEGPLCKRGWVAQERALSTRTLHFGKCQIFWECLKTNATEVYPKGLLTGTEIKDPKALLKPGGNTFGDRLERLRAIRTQILDMPKMYRPSIKELGLSPRDFRGCDPTILDGLDIEGWHKLKQQLYKIGFGDPKVHMQPLHVKGMPLELQQWTSAVHFYSICSLSFPKDKLVAISGMAQVLARKLECEYLAGLWRKDLEHQLLWKVCGKWQVAPIQDGTRGPSWCWASVDGEVKIPDWGDDYHPNSNPVTWLAKVDDARVDFGRAGMFGPVKSGVLTLTGHLGVFRVETEGQAQSNAVNSQVSHERNRLIAFWDTIGIADRISADKVTVNGGLCFKRYYIFHYDERTYNNLGTSDIFYMPFRIMDADYFGFDYESPVLTGLLLLPISGRHGFYRRIGQFEIPARWLDKSESFEPMTTSTEIEDSHFFITKHKKGQYTICVV